LARMSNPVHVVLLLALLVFWIGPAVLAARVAERKGRSFAVYLVVSLVIGWPIPLIAALILPRRGVPV
jgi:hypothetical protein